MTTLPHFDIWVDASTSNGTTLLVPHVVAATNANLVSETTLTTLNAAGTSNVTQRRDMRLVAARDETLGSVRTNATQPGQCVLRVRLLDGDVTLASLAYDCMTGQTIR